MGIGCELQHGYENQCCQSVEVIVPYINAKVASNHVMPALVTLGSDQNPSVKYASIDAFGVVAQHFKNDTIVEKIRVQMDAFLEDGSHGISVMLILWKQNIPDFDFLWEWLPQSLLKFVHREYLILLLLLVIYLITVSGKCLSKSTSKDQATNTLVSSRQKQQSIRLDLELLWVITKAI